MATSEVFWSDPASKRAIVWRFSGSMGWDSNRNREELRRLNLEISQDRLFTPIFDFRDVTQLPPFPISRMSMLRQRTPKNQEQIIVVIKEGSAICQPMRLMADVFQTIYSYPIWVTESMEEAYALVDRHYHKDSKNVGQQMGSSPGDHSSL
jgi:hypothetical protein